MAKIRVQLVLDDAKKTEWIESFEQKGRFPNNDVPCSSCSEGVTMFGTNLKNRVEKFGSAKKLLAEFVCRDCKGKIKRGELIAPKASDVEAVATEDEVIEEEANDETPEVICEEDSEESYVTCEEEDDSDDEVVEEDTDDDSEESVQEVNEEECGEDCECDEEEDEEEASASKDELKERYKAFYSLKK